VTIPASVSYSASASWLPPFLCTVLVRVRRIFCAVSDFDVHGNVAILFWENALKRRKRCRKSAPFPRRYFIVSFCELFLYQPADECCRPPLRLRCFFAAAHSFFGWYKYIHSGLLPSFLLHFDSRKFRIAILNSLIWRHIYHSRSSLPSFSFAYQFGLFKLGYNTAGFTRVTVQYTAHIADGKENEQLTVLVMPAVFCG